MVLVLLLLAAPASAMAQEDTYNGSQLWLRYTPVADAERYRATVSNIVVENASADPVYRHTASLGTEAGGTERLVRTSLEAARAELERGLPGLLGTSVPVVETPTEGSVVVGTRDSSPLVAAAVPASDLLSPEGYVIRSVGGRTIIAGRTQVGALYGTFAFLRLIQTAQPITGLNVSSAPKIKHRHLNYWDTERLYAGNNANGTGGLNGENGALFNFAATGTNAAPSGSSCALVSVSGANRLSVGAS